VLQLPPKASPTEAETPGDDAPITAKAFDGTEVVFMMCGLPPERAAALRADVEHNKIASVETRIDELVARSFSLEIN
jgi:hypothetical protein